MKMSKKILAVVLAAILAFAFAACAKSNTDDDAKNTDASNVKVGFIYLHDENSTYDKNFIDAGKEEYS